MTKRNEMVEMVGVGVAVTVAAIGCFLLAAGMMFPGGGLVALVGLVAALVGGYSTIRIAG